MKTDFFQQLIQDHEKAKKMFQEIMAKEEIDRDRVEALCDDLLLHMKLEERFYYPTVEKLRQTEDMAKEADLEHKEARKIIKTLQAETLDDIELKVKVELLQLAIEHHVEEEEGELFPKSKKALTAEQIREITEQMIELREKELSAIQK